MVFFLHLFQLDASKCPQSVDQYLSSTSENSLQISCLHPILSSFSKFSKTFIRTSYCTTCLRTCVHYYFFSFDNFYRLLLSSHILSSAMFHLLLGNWITCSFWILSISRIEVFSFHCFYSPFIYNMSLSVNVYGIFLEDFHVLGIQCCC